MFSRTVSEKVYLEHQLNCCGKWMIMMMMMMIIIIIIIITMMVEMMIIYSRVYCVCVFC